MDPQDTSVTSSSTATTLSTRYGSCTKLVDSSNYREWRKDIKMILKGAHVFRMVDNDDPEPPAGPAHNRAHAWLQWQQRKETASALLWSSLASTARSLVETCDEDEPHEIWTELQRRLDRARNNNVAAARVRNNFDMESWKEGVDTLSSWYGRLISYQGKVAGTTWGISNEHIAMKLLMGLPGKWATIREQIMGSNQELELGDVIAALESNADVVAAATSVSASGTGNTEALISLQGLKEKPYQHNGNGNGGGRGRGRGNGRGNYHGRQGHGAGRFHGIDKSTNIHAGMQCNCCKKIGHIRRNCWHAKPREEDVQAAQDTKTAAIAVTDNLFPQYATALIAAVVTPTNETPAWLVDSGAAQHITFSIKDFEAGSYKRFRTPTKVKVGDGQYVDGIGKGTVKLNGLRLHDV